MSTLTSMQIPPCVVLPPWAYAPSGDQLRFMVAPECANNMIFVVHPGRVLWYKLIRDSRQPLILDKNPDLHELMLYNLDDEDEDWSI